MYVSENVELNMQSTQMAMKFKTHHTTQASAAGQAHNIRYTTVGPPCDNVQVDQV